MALRRSTGATRRRAARRVRPGGDARGDAVADRRTGAAPGGGGRGRAQGGGGRRSSRLRGGFAGAGGRVLVRRHRVVGVGGRPGSGRLDRRPYRRPGRRGGGGARTGGAEAQEEAGGGGGGRRRRNRAPSPTPSATSWRSRTTTPRTPTTRRTGRSRSRRMLPRRSASALPSRALPTRRRRRGRSRMEMGCRGRSGGPRRLASCARSSQPSCRR